MDHPADRKRFTIRAAEARIAPREGDVVVTREARGPSRFTICQTPGVVQISAPTLDEALHIARAFALERALDLWYREGGTCRLLEVYRSRDDATRAPAAR